MIDFLINVAYNIGMFMLGLLIIFCGLIYLKVKAEHTPEHANYMMLQELRKLNRHQQEQLEREERAQIQASKQWEVPAPQKPGFWDRMNMKLDQLNQRTDEKLAKQKAKRLVKKSKTQPFKATPSAELDWEQALHKAQSQLETVRMAVEARRQELAEAEANITPEFWEYCATLKAQFVTEGNTKAVAQIEATLAELETLRQQTKKAVEEEEAELERLTAAFASMTSPSLPPPLSKQATPSLKRLKAKQARLEELEKRWMWIQPKERIDILKNMMKEENTPADIIYTVIEEDFNDAFWEDYAAIKAEYAALKEMDMVAKIEAEHAYYKTFKQELEAVLFPELTATQTPTGSRSTPPPLPPMR